MNKLTEALRQYRHNKTDGFVFGYDKDIVDRLVTSLEAELERTKRFSKRQGKQLELCAKSNNPPTPAKGLSMPGTVEHYQANAARDNELILEMKDEISRLKQSLHQARVKIGQLRGDPV